MQPKLPAWGPWLRQSAWRKPVCFVARLHCRQGHLLHFPQQMFQLQASCAGISFPTCEVKALLCPSLLQQLTLRCLDLKSAPGPPGPPSPLAASHLLETLPLPALSSDCGMLGRLLLNHAPLPSCGTLSTRFMRPGPPFAEQHRSLATAETPCSHVSCPSLLRDTL